MSVALDIGAGTLRSLSRRVNRLVARRCRSLYAVLEDTKAQRQLLRQTSISFAACEDGLVLIGDAAAEYSRVCQLPAVPLLPAGRLSRNDPPSRPVLIAILDALLPRPKVQGELCVMTIPGPDSGGSSAACDEHQFFTHLVGLKGYAPETVRAGRALVLAEMATHAFTGVALSIGAATTEVMVAHHGNDVASRVVPFGGQWIDERIARVNDEIARDTTGNWQLHSSRIARWKEAVTNSILSPKTAAELQLAELYDGLLDYILRNCCETIEDGLLELNSRSRLPLVVAGGPTRLPGFATLFSRKLESTSFAPAIGSVRLAAASEYTIARGCLIHAEIESRVLDYATRPAA